MCTPLPEVEESAFTEVSISGLSDIHGCLGGSNMIGQADSWQGITTRLADETEH